MTPERLQRVESLARAALERPPAERPAFLAEAATATRSCASEEMLSELREVREEATFRARQELHLSQSGASAQSARGGAARGGAGRGWGRAALLAAATLVVLSALIFGVYQPVSSRRATPPPALARGTQTNDVMMMTDFR
ncbi:MAG TPA: hypothetical protein VGV38_09180 [Pyrinomonadaceae bacterium]|nr:hypothetical protein [Pyrinomonadaceae bacterium]